MLEYREIIKKAIDRVIELHGTDDPYYQKILRELLEDLKDFEAQKFWMSRPSPFTSLDEYLNYIMNLLWREWFEQ